jgi:hypothetical protein
LLPDADDVDILFSALEQAADRPSEPGLLATDLGEVQGLLGRMAVNHTRQVRDFMIELRWGPTPPAWIAVCEPSLQALRRAAERLDFGTLAVALAAFAASMRGDALATVIEGSWRDRILASYIELERILPDTFALDTDKSQREAKILHTLLAQIPDVGKVTIDKIYAAGLTTLEAMFLATPSDLAATSGISDLLAERIVERFCRYKSEIASAAVDETGAAGRQNLRALVERLRRENEEFADASAAWTDEARQRKREVLHTRAQTMLDIDLRLARLGEIALVRELERLPFAEKERRLESFLTEAEEKYETPAPRR